MSEREVPRAGLVRAARDGRVTNAEGARALGLSVRQFRRLRAACGGQGARGLVHGNRGQPSPRRLGSEARARIMALMAGKYAGFNDCHLTEKLRTVEKLTLSRELVRQLRPEAKLPAKRKRRAPKHRRRRERTGREGALVLIDGGRHDWLEGRGPRFTLVGAMDDASGRILALVVRDYEELHGYFALFGQPACARSKGTATWSRACADAGWQARGLREWGQDAACLGPGIRHLLDRLPRGWARGLRRADFPGSARGRGGRQGSALLRPPQPARHPARRSPTPRKPAPDCPTTIASPSTSGCTSAIPTSGRRARSSPKQRTRPSGRVLDNV